MNAVLALPVGPRDHTVGRADAPVTLVEYGDFECPRCALAFSRVEAARKRLGSLMRFSFREFPLVKVHPHAEDAAEMAEAAASQGRFWPMYNLLFTHQEALDPRHLVAYAAEVGLDARWAAAALLSYTFAPRVREHVLSGVRSGVDGTPTFFINGRRFDDPWDGPMLLEALETAAQAAARM